MSASDEYASPAVAGSGTIACALSACATALGPVRLLARSDASAWRAEEQAQAQAGELPDGDPSKLKVTTSAEELADCDLVVEAIIEDADSKGELLASLAETCPDADLASTTSSLSITGLAKRGGAPERLYGLHVFNPVAKMDLVELCLPAGLRDGTAKRARDLCERLGKTAVEVPDQAGFVVNRLLFPFLFDAVRMVEESGLEPDAVDSCMTLGANHPMGPLRLLDFVGVDVAVAIGRGLHADTGTEAHRPPQLLERMAADGNLGRKSGAGFYTY